MRPPISRAYLPSSVAVGVRPEATRDFAADY
jgi:hypothetical protein